MWEARIKKGLHKDEHVAIKEVDLEEMGDKNLENLSVSLFKKSKKFICKENSLTQLIPRISYLKIILFFIARNYHYEFPST